MSDYDLLVIGDDPGGLAAAVEVASGGLRVALVANGPCSRQSALTALLDVATRVTEGFCEMSDSWREFLTLHDQLVAQAQNDIEMALARAKVTVLEGEARLLGPQRVLIKTAGTAKEVAAERIVLASGSRPQALAGVGFDERVLAAEEVNRCRRRPQSALVLGAGPEALETAWAMRAMGCQVTWAFPTDQPLLGFEPSLVDGVLDSLQSQGIALHRQTKMRSYEATATGFCCLLDDRRQGIQEPQKPFVGECLIVARGRRPHSATLGLNTVAVVLDKRGHVQVDHVMQTGERQLFAVGDLLPTSLGPEVAAREGALVARHILGQVVSPIRYQRLPHIVRSRPGLGAIGLTQEAAEAEGYLVRRNENSTSDVSAGGQLVIIEDEETGQILGAHLLETPITAAVLEEAIKKPPTQ